MTSKEQFTSNKKLASWWATISHDTQFDAVLLHASACALEGCPSAEERNGVIKFREILLTLSDNDSPDVVFAGSGINYDIEPKRKTLEVKPESKTKPPAKKS